LFLLRVFFVCFRKVCKKNIQNAHISIVSLKQRTFNLCGFQRAFMRPKDNSKFAIKTTKMIFFFPKSIQIYCRFPCNLSEGLGGDCYFIFNKFGDIVRIHQIIIEQGMLLWEEEGGVHFFFMIEVADK